jgi:hypothetical protein
VRVYLDPDSWPPRPGHFPQTARGFLEPLIRFVYQRGFYCRLLFVRGPDRESSKVSLTGWHCISLFISSRENAEKVDHIYHLRCSISLGS